MCAKNILICSIGLGGRGNGTLNWIVLPSFSSFIPPFLLPINKHFLNPRVDQILSLVCSLQISLEDLNKDGITRSYQGVKTEEILNLEKEKREE